ncbi:MAG: hypothetical protein ACKO23_03880, partial [Gemmataceae bacterium]
STIASEASAKTVVVVSEDRSAFLLVRLVAMMKFLSEGRMLAVITKNTAAGFHPVKPSFDGRWVQPKGAPTAQSPRKPSATAAPGPNFLVSSGSPFTGLGMNAMKGCVLCRPENANPYPPLSYKYRQGLASRANPSFPLYVPQLFTVPHPTGKFAPSFDNRKLFRFS